MSRLRGEALARDELTPELTGRLYVLFAEHYDGADPERFRQDLTEKQWVLLLRDPDGEPAGFSTQRLIVTSLDGRPVRALFSGDTIIRREFWGSQELVRTWCRFAGGLKRAAGETPLYWFLISKGYRTYLYLPLFFNEFFPRCDRPTPPLEQRLLDHLAAVKFRETYDPETGIIIPPSPRDRLKPELDASPSRSRSPHVEFFLRRNPRYMEGAELACVAEISPSNMRGTARRELEAGMRGDSGEP